MPGQADDSDNCQGSSPSPVQPFHEGLQALQQDQAPSPRGWNAPQRNRDFVQGGGPSEGLGRTQPFLAEPRASSGQALAAKSIRMGMPVEDLGYQESSFSKTALTTADGPPAQPAEDLGYARPNHRDVAVSGRASGLPARAAEPQSRAMTGSQSVPRGGAPQQASGRKVSVLPSMLMLLPCRANVSHKRPNCLQEVCFTWEGVPFTLHANVAALSCEYSHKRPSFQQGVLVLCGKTGPALCRASGSQWLRVPDMVKQAFQSP